MIRIANAGVQEKGVWRLKACPRSNGLRAYSLNFGTRTIVLRAQEDTQRWEGAHGSYSINTCPRNP
jgi:hypothetical protein